MVIENEVKYKIKSVNNIKRKLSFAGFRFDKKIYQEDYYFSPPHKSFAGTKKYYLRLRRDNEGGKFEYHIARSNLQTQERKVYIDNFKEFFNILKLLDFKMDCVVKKNRLIYTKGNIKIVIDTIKNLGNFIEIEYCGRWTDNIKKQFKELINLFQLNRNDKISGVGYPDLLMMKKL
ncbi:class IV adenylate cyclase [Patescibacteria group bacterium]|nr:class IV adenylate cyclase [Patescibacteria group bacterium]MBU4455231.1 class IV adenylate cyclase [Patescibacteria group bacterium]MCG2691004.1 class IV adenylate cyclase [Candidatus Parcubacteria bacterium]